MNARFKLGDSKKLIYVRSFSILLIYDDCQKCFTILSIVLFVVSAISRPVFEVLIIIMAWESAGGSLTQGDTQTLQPSTFSNNNSGAGQQGEITYPETINPALLDNRLYPPASYQNEPALEFESQHNLAINPVQYFEDGNQSLQPSFHDESISLPLYDMAVTNAYQQGDSVPQFTCESCPSITFSTPGELK